jgi:short-subunit dehydrogenase
MDLLVNNAGICGAGLVGEFSPDNFRKILDVNLFGAIYGCQACLPWLHETASDGAIVNIASLAAALSAPAMAAYNMSKSGLVSLSETLYGELLGSGIHVSVAMPFFFASNLLDRGRFKDSTFKQIAEAYTRNAEFTADDVVVQTMRAVERKKLYVILGFRARTAARLKRLAPIWFLRMVARIFEKQKQKVLRDGCS